MEFKYRHKLTETTNWADNKENPGIGFDSIIGLTRFQSQFVTGFMWVFHAASAPSHVNKPQYCGRRCSKQDSKLAVQWIRKVVPVITFHNNSNDITMTTVTSIAIQLLTVTRGDLVCGLESGTLANDNPVCR